MRVARYQLSQAVGADVRPLPALADLVGRIPRYPSVQFAEARLERGSMLPTGMLNAELIRLYGASESPTSKTKGTPGRAHRGWHRPSTYRRV